MKSKHPITFSLALALATHCTLALSNDKTRKVENRPQQTLTNPYAQKAPQAKKPTRPINPTSQSTRVVTPPKKGAFVGKTRQYKIPGATAISTAKRYGYQFGVEMDSAPKGCRFMSTHWQLPKKTACKIYGFKSVKSKCKKLRNGWKILDIKFDNFDPAHEQQANSYYLPQGSVPLLELAPWNTTKKARPLSIKHLILEGPDGSFNRFKEAFSHCTDSTYQN